MTRMAPCPSDLDWTRWFAGELDEERRGLLLAHLDGCEDCRAVCAALAPADTAAPPVGGERYTLGDEIARGGMGRILRARDRVLGRPVALKLPHFQSGAQERFAREIAILAMLSHPSIVTVLDAGHLDAETPFFAMPFLAGRTLAAEVAAGHAGRELLLATIPAISAIAYAHSLGIVHRDVKPTNLFIGAFGECTVLDWGLAIVFGEDPPDQRGGSEGYASPEQQDGLPPKLDHDVFALGSVLRFVMLGTHRASAADRALPPELRSIITRATAPSGTRYASATELLADVQRYLSQGRVLAHRYSARQHVARWVRRHRTAAAALATATLAASAVAAWSVSRIVDERDRALEAERHGRAARTRTRALTAFLLDEVNHSVAELGRLDLATNLLAGLEQHVTSAPPDLGDPDERAEDIQQVELRGLMADIAIAKGDYDGALRHIAPVDATLARLPPAAPLTTYLRCEALGRTADLRRAKGEPSAARTALQACLDALARVPREVSLGYPRFDLVHAAATAHAALGDLLRDEGDATAALAAYEQAAAVFRGVADPGDDRIAGARLVLEATIAERRGTLAQFGHRNAEAEAHFRAAIALAETAVARRESEATAQWLVVQLTLALAMIAGERNAIDDKRTLVAKAARIADPLYAIDPTHEGHARTMTILWRAQAETGPAAAAPALWNRILEVSRRRTQLEPRSARAWRDLAVDLTAMATTFADGEDRTLHARALPLCDEGLAAMKHRRTLLPADVIDSDLALTMLHCGEIALALEQVPLAQTYRQAAIAESKAHASRADTGMLTAYAIALAAYLTDAPAAERTAQRPEMERLWAELVAAKADDLMANVRELAPWWKPK